MAASETLSSVFRNTSLTMRERFTPARSCSTLTRIRANFRLARFSAAESSPRGGFFFRLASFLHRRLLPLESGVLVQDGIRRIGDPFGIRDLLLVRLAGVCRAQVVNPFPPGVDDDYVLVAVLLLAPALVQGLFFWVFGPLAPSFRGVDDQPGLLLRSRLAPGEVPGVPLRADAEVIQSSQ